MSSPRPIFDCRRARTGSVERYRYFFLYQYFLPEPSFPVIRTGVNGEGTDAPFCLFFSAFGFFFSRLLRI